MILQSWRGFFAIAGEPVRVGGCFAFTGEPDPLEEVLPYHQDYYGKGEVLQKQVVLFIWKLLPSAAVIQINDDDVFQRFYRIWKDVMTAPTDRWGLGNRY